MMRIHNPNTTNRTTTLRKTPATSTSRMSAQAQETIRFTFPTLESPPYPKLTCGLPFYMACANHVRDTFKAQRPYIVASKTLSEKTEFLTQLQDALGSSLVGTYIGIPSHTPSDALLPIIDDMRQKRADCLITLGGGSVSDGGKLISLSLANNIHTLEQLKALPRIGDDGAVPEDYSNVNPCTIPVICIPISLSGGEYTRFAGVTDSSTHAKYQFTHPTMYPALVILDTTLTQGTPMRTWLGSGVRSIDHCIEGYLSLNADPQGDKAALEALPSLVNGLLRTKANPDDLDARLACQLGSNISLTPLQQGVKKGASHGIGHQLGPLGVAHGETSCILLPTVCKFNARVNSQRQQVLKDLLLKEDAVKQILDEANIDTENSDLGDVLRAVFDKLGMPRCLKDVGIGEDKLDDLAQNCLVENYVISNPRPLKTKEDVLELLHLVLE